MKIRSNNRNGYTVTLEVEEDYEKFSEFIDKNILEAAREIKIPGFRPGKAPRAMVEKVLNHEFIEAQAAQDLISSIYPLIMEETGHDPVDYPRVQILEKKKKQPIVFKVEIDVYPEVKLGKYKGLKVDKKESAVGEEELAAVLENFRKRMAESEKSELPPLNDEFARKASRFNTLEELKRELKSGMQKERESQADAEMRNQLVSLASSDADVDLPKGMIEREIDVMLDEFRNSLAPMNLTLEDYLKGIKKEEANMREELRKSAEIRVKGKVVLAAVAQAEKMEISEEEMNEELKHLAEAGGQSFEEAGAKLDEHARRYIKEYLLRRKALDFMVGKARLNIVAGKEEKKDA